MKIKPKLCISGIGLIVLSLSLFLAHGFYVTPLKLAQDVNITPINVSIKDTSLNSSVITPTATPEAQIQPDAELLPYNAGECTKDGIYVSCDPEKYLIPDNEVVKAYASWLYISKDKRLLLYKADNPYGYPEGTQIQIKFVSDKEYLGKYDYWINPDYYLTHNLVGDCEDGAFAIASILEAKGIKAKVVWGWLTIDNERSKDALVEFKLDGIYYRYFTGTSIFNGVKLRDKIHSRISFEPLFMYGYGDSYYNEYRSNW